MNWPGKLSGTHPLVPWLNKVLAQSQRAVVRAGWGIIISDGTSGQIVKLDSSVIGGGGAEIEMTDCVTGKTYFVKARLKPDPEA